MKTYFSILIAATLFFVSFHSNAQNLILDGNANQECMEVFTFTDELNEAEQIFLKLKVADGVQLFLDLKKLGYRAELPNAQPVSCAYLTQMNKISDKIHNNELAVFYKQQGNYRTQTYRVQQVYYIFSSEEFVNIKTKGYSFSYDFKSNDKKDLAAYNSQAKVRLDAEMQKDCYQTAIFTAESRADIGAYTRLTINSKMGIVAMEKVSSGLDGTASELKLDRIDNYSYTQYLGLLCQNPTLSNNPALSNNNTVTPLSVDSDTPQEYNQNGLFNENFRRNTTPPAYTYDRREAQRIYYDLDRKAYFDFYTKDRANGVFGNIEYRNGEMISQDHEPGTADYFASKGDIPVDYYQAINVPIVPECDEVSTLDTHIFQTGETLQSISRLYGIDENHLLRWNGISSAQELEPCMRLSLKNPVTTYSQTPPRIICGEKSTATTHVVQQGETIFTIARNYNLSVQELKGWNGLQYDEVPVCSRLTLLAPKILGNPMQRPSDYNNTSARLTGKGNVDIPESYDQGTPEFYVVKQGENLFQIAKRFNLSIAELKARNNLKSDLIKANQRLRILPNLQSKGSIPTDVPQEYAAAGGSLQVHVVQANETLFGIAKKYKMKLSDLKAMNNLDKEMIYKGQALKIYGSVARINPPAPVPVASSCGEKNTKVSHVVQPGETLASIGRKYNLTANQLRQWNALDSNEKVPVCFRVYIDVPKYIER